MSSYQLGNLRVVDLTKVLDPKTETRRCGLTRFNTGGPIPDFHTIMDLTSHLGTHVECPYHHNDDWTDVEGLPLTTFMGRAIYVNITHMEPNGKIKGEDLEKACGDRIKEGDIVILDSPMKLAPFTPDSNTEKDKRLFICRETAEFPGKIMEADEWVINKNGTVYTVSSWVDAENSFGAQIRSNFIVTYNWDGNPDVNPTVTNVTIN